MSLIKIENIEKTYKLGKTYVQALRNVSLEIKEADMACLMGPSGSGKTTLLNILSGIDYPEKGNVCINNTNLLMLNDDKLSEFRSNTLGFIFQSFNLVPVLNAFENIEYPLVLQKIPRPERVKRVEDLMDALGIKKLKKHRPDEMSGGQKQRVAIARALVAKPKIVVADEPTGNLDHKTGSSIMELMKEMNEKSKTTFIFSTHDPLVSKYSSRLVRLFDGQIVEDNSNN